MDIDELRQEIENANDVDDLSPKAEQQVRALAGVAKSWFRLRELAQDIFDEDDQSKLQEMLDKQDELDERIRSKKHLASLSMADEINRICTAISNETEELRDTVPWKWWSLNDAMNREAAREELIDVFHFWLSAANLLGMDASDIYNKYMDKNEVNHNRQDGDY